MSLEEHARRELTLTGEEPDVIDWYSRVVKEFASFGHSGGSAFATIPVLHELLQYHALTDLTSDPAEWMDRTAESGRPMWQNIRDSRTFSEDGGKTHYRLDENHAPDGLRVAFRFADINIRVTCECEWTATGDSANDAFGAWWKHRAAAHPDAD